MEKIEIELKEIEEKLAKLKDQKEQLLEARNNVNMQLGQVEVELLRLQGEQRLAEKLKKDDKPKSSDKGNNA